MTRSIKWQSAPCRHRILRSGLSPTLPGSEDLDRKKMDAKIPAGRRGDAAELFFIADRAVLKIYALDANRSLRLLERLDILEAKGRFDKEYTDRAGAFPAGGTAGQGNSTAEKQTLVAENEMRSFRRIASRIMAMLDGAPRARWSFAAPPEIDGAILDGIPESYKASLRAKVRKDLVNVAEQKLLSHFGDNQAVRVE